MFNRIRTFFVLLYTRYFIIVESAPYLALLLMTTIVGQLLDARNAGIAGSFNRGYRRVITAQGNFGPWYNRALQEVLLPPTD